MTIEEGINYIKANNTMIGHLRYYNPIIKDVVWMQDNRYFRVYCDVSKDGENGKAHYNISLHDLELDYLRNKMRVV
jgi:hypothetical protein